MKIFRKLMLLLVVLIVVGVVIAWLGIDWIAKKGLEKGTSYALGVETEVDSLRLSLLKGSLKIDTLRIANPKGFTSPYLMQSGRFDLELRPGSLFSDTIEMNRFELDGLDMHIEQRLTGSNISKVVENLRRFESQSPADRQKQAGDKKVKLDRVVITNVEAHFHLAPDVVSQELVTVKIPEIVLTDVASDEGGVLVADVVGRLVLAILSQVIEQSHGHVPETFLQGLDKTVGSLTETLGGAIDVLLKQPAALPKP